MVKFMYYFAEMNLAMDEIIELLDKQRFSQSMRTLRHWCNIINDDTGDPEDLFEIAKTWSVVFQRDPS